MMRQNRQSDGMARSRVMSVRTIPGGRAIFLLDPTPPGGSCAHRSSRRAIGRRSTARSGPSMRSAVGRSIDSARTSPMAFSSGSPSGAGAATGTWLSAWPIQRPSGSCRSNRTRNSAPSCRCGEARPQVGGQRQRFGRAPLLRPTVDLPDHARRRRPRPGRVAEDVDPARSRLPQESRPSRPRPPRPRRGSPRSRPRGSPRRGVPAARGPPDRGRRRRRSGGPCAAGSCRRPTAAGRGSAAGSARRNEPRPPAARP